MTEAEARARIEDETAWNTAPALSVVEVDRLLAAARVTDTAGKKPGEVGYVNTYTLVSAYASVAMGLRWKSSKVAGQYDLSAGDVDLKRSQAYTNLARRASAAGGIGTITLTTALAEA